ncbi:MAG: hypothetical protein R3A51_20620 [Nannocystaceae bacterium]|nr:hypothetical protein [Myxococcales bacterium]
MSIFDHRASGWDEWIERALASARLHGIGLLRIALGSLLLYRQIAYYGQRGSILEARVEQPFTSVLAAYGLPNASIYTLVDSSAWLSLVYILAIVATALWTVGLCTRSLTPLIFAVAWSLPAQFGGLGVGFEGVIQALISLGVVRDASARWSVDAWLRRRWRGGVGIKSSRFSVTGRPGR